MAEEPPPSEHHDLQSKHENAHICRVESARPILLRRGRLPPELIDIIINHLHTDRSALTTCALVCRSWVPASRLHLFPLFSKLHVHSATKEHIRILSSPLCTIASAVQHVVLEKPEFRSNLLTLFPRLPKTTHLTLGRRQYFPLLHALGLQDRSPHFKLAALAPLSHQLECLVLESIQLDMLDLFFSLLRSFPRLQRVACCDVSFKILFNEPHPRTLPTDQGFHMPELRVLEMHSSGKLLSRLVERWGNAIPQLTMLRTDCRDELGLSALMETVGSSLQKLEVSGFASDFPSIIRSFASLTQLEHFKLEVQGNPAEIAELLLHSLRHLPSTCLKEVEVFTVGEYFGYVDCAAWSQIDSLVTTPQFQPTLRVLCFGFGGHSNWLRPVRETLGMRFPLCTERDILRVVSWERDRHF